MTPFRSAGALSAVHVGRQVTVRYRLSDGRASDVIGVLESIDDETLVVRDRGGEARRIARADVVAARVVRAR